MFERIAAATPDDDGLDEDFIRGLAGRVLNLEADGPAGEVESWWRPANNEQVVEWWDFACQQYTKVHPEVPSPTDAQVIGGQLFADRMGGD